MPIGVKPSSDENAPSWKTNTSAPNITSSAFDLAQVTDLTLEELLDRMVDPLIAFNVANPGAKALLANSDMPARLEGAARPLHEAVVGRVAAIIEARSPRLAAAERDLSAMVAVRIVAAMMPPIVAAQDAERNTLTAELKKALYGYIAPLDASNQPRADRPEPARY